MSPTLDILFEDPHIIVCKKPAGIATQSKSLRGMDMEHMIKRHLYKTSLSNPKNPTKESGEPYLAVIHRLDQPVSGILVFGKTPAAARELNKQLQAHNFGKHYKALLIGTPPQEFNQKPLIHYMKKDSKTNTSSVCTSTDALGKKASLQYQIIPHPSTQDLQLFSHCNIPDLNTVTMVQIELHTGRHHQIRVQMSTLGCPIWGDTKYGSSNQTQASSSDAAWTNIALCAYKLEFNHPITKKPLVFQL